VGGEEKKVPKKKNQLGLRKGKEKVNFSSVPWFNPRTRRDEKGAPISAPSIHIGALVGAGSFWSQNG
jgi:hypothetical protein